MSELDLWSAAAAAPRVKVAAMRGRAYPKPPITVAGLFRDPHAVAEPELPQWWRNNDKQRVLSFTPAATPGGVAGSVRWDI